MAATLVRYLYGLPFALLYVAYLFSDGDIASVDPGMTFYVSGLIAGVLQILATVILIRLFALRNFAVGSTFVRSEILLTAIIGITLFTEQVTVYGWVAMLICVAGLMLISVAKSGEMNSLWDRSGLYGLGAGLAFALTLAISIVYFKEMPTGKELVGMSLK